MINQSCPLQLQGRYGKGSGQEYLQHFMVEYKRPGILSEWRLYSDKDSQQVKPMWKRNTLYMVAEDAGYLAGESLLEIQLFIPKVHYHLNSFFLGGATRKPMLTQQIDMLTTERGFIYSYHDTQTRMSPAHPLL